MSLESLIFNYRWNVKINMKVLISQCKVIDITFC